MSAVADFPVCYQIELLIRPYTCYVFIIVNQYAFLMKFPDFFLTNILLNS